MVENLKILCGSYICEYTDLYKWSYEHNLHCMFIQKTLFIKNTNKTITIHCNQLQINHYSSVFSVLQKINNLPIWHHAIACEGIRSRSLSIHLLVAHWPKIKNVVNLRQETKFNFTHFSVEIHFPLINYSFKIFYEALITSHCHQDNMKCNWWKKLTANNVSHVAS